MPWTDLPPRILLVMPTQWPRALLRAALREIGYDAIGTRTVRGARRLLASDEGRGPVRLILLDQDALTEDAQGDLDKLRRASDAALVLLAPATRRVSEGGWTGVLRRPLTVGELTQAIERLVPLTPTARRSVD
jgi:DNA-binding response OmpR family regulator